MNRKRVASIISLLALLAVPALADEPVIGGPCEGCEAVFQGLPGELNARARIAPEGEPGYPLVVEGTVRNADGKPIVGVIVYAYQTNADGIYPPDERFEGKAAYRHGKLRAWAKTDEQGRYRFDTIRPGSYPDTNIPQHIHMHIIEPERCTYYISDVQFDDDPLLSSRQRERQKRGRGGNGVVVPRKNDDGVWHVQRDVVLGERIAGYQDI